MISCNITYYNEPRWLVWWYDAIRKLNDKGIPICLNVADDGSMIEPAEKFFDRFHPTDNMRLFRITEDLGFNSHGARNLLMKQTQTDWNIMSDIDRNYPSDTLVFLANNVDKLVKGNYYSFNELTPASPDKFSINEYVVHREDFWNAGGYDEEFVNVHWGDRIFLDCLQLVANRVKSTDIKVQYVRKARNVFWEDVPITQYPDDNTLIHPSKGDWARESKRKALVQMVTERNKTPEGRASKKVVNFPWVRIF